MLWIITLITALIGAVLGYKLGCMIFANARVQKNLREITKLIKELKKVRKDERRATIKDIGGRA